jgi:hypothetical protein
MDRSRSGTLEDEGAAALTLMQEALVLLDRCNDATAVGAHLDLAICRLRDMIASNQKTSPTVDGRIGEIRDSGAAS